MNNEIVQLIKSNTCSIVPKNSVGKTFVKEEKSDGLADRIFVQEAICEKK